MLAAEIIRIKRDGGALDDAHLHAAVSGITDGSWGDGQVAALAMAIWLRGMSRAECVALTQAMTRSGRVLDWRGSGLDRPVLDKHSTGGVGDWVSLALAPIVAACGGGVPMISGRGLGHTGGTLDKLEALPGYTVAPSDAQLRAVLRETGCAIVGASAELAPADRRLYGIRDVTATVESIPLITASILSKKLAAGLQGLVMDVKVGNGAFMPTRPQADALADSLVQVAAGAGLPTAALITDMDEPLAATAGNALEVAEALALLTGRPGPLGIDRAAARVRALTLQLSGRLLALGGLAADPADGVARATAALDDGRAAEAFARMVRGLGGPADVLHDPALPAAPVRQPVPAAAGGVLVAVDTRAVGLAVVALGGGRRRAGDAVDPRVGFSGLLPVGTAVAAGQALAWVHAADAAAADAAAQALLAACQVSPDAAPAAGRPVVLGRLEPAV